MDTRIKTTPEIAAHPDQRIKRDMSHIQGWGADLDLKNRPAYPKERTPPRLDNVHWDVVEQQPVNIKVHHSIERPDITPVFGTSTPPTGWSGKIRDIAFAMSENDIRHWLLLMLADRVNVVEGIAQDLRDGHVPNILGEMGIKAEIRHNPVGFAAKVLIVGGILGITYRMRQRKKLR